MASITKQRVGKYTYLYESVSYRNEDGKPRNKKHKIGKIDPDTGETIYTPGYVKGASTKNGRATPDGEISCEARKYANRLFDGVKTYGIYWFLYNIGKQIGLLGISMEAFPSLWRELSAIASCLVASGKPLMYCEDRIEENDRMEAGSMTSQRISEPFARHDERQRNKFYRLWVRPYSRAGVPCA